METLCFDIERQERLGKKQKKELERAKRVQAKFQQRLIEVVGKEAVEEMI